MKKFIAGLLLSIYLFNIGGQLVLHQYFVYLSDRLFNEQASKGRYNVNDLTEVKIPVNMPSITDWKAYENITGKVQFGNVSYNYTKMKITRTAIYLMCIPDYAATRLTDKNIIPVDKVANYPVPKKNHVPFGKLMLLNKFDYAFLRFEFTPPFKCITETVVEPVQLFDYYAPDTPEQPPRLSC